LSVHCNLTGGGIKFEWRAFKRLSRELESFWTFTPMWGECLFCLSLIQQGWYIQKCLL